MSLILRQQGTKRDCFVACAPRNDKKNGHCERPEGAWQSRFADECKTTQISGCLLLVWISLIFFCGLAWAEGTGGRAGAYLNLGMDARPLAMGSAFTASCFDASAGYWNPAGLGTLTRQEALASYAFLPGSGDYTQLAYALPVSEFNFPADQLAGSSGSSGPGVLGFSLLRYAAAYDIEARSIDSLNPEYLFSDIEGAYSLAYSREVYPGLSAGLSLKGLYQTLDRTDANGWGADAGLLWQPLPAWRAALSIRNLYAQLFWSTGRQELFPINAALGGAYQYEPRPEDSVLLEIDLKQSALGAVPLTWHAGAEYGFKRSLFVRAGWDAGVWSGGIGLRIPRIGWGRATLDLDYALRPDRIAGLDHWLTLRLEM